MNFHEFISAVEGKIVSENLTGLITELAPIFGHRTAVRIVELLDAHIDERLRSHQDAIDVLIDRLPPQDAVTIEPAPSPLPQTGDGASDHGPTP